jgi:hypothetical protein
MPLREILLVRVRVPDNAAVALELQLGASLGDCEGLTRMTRSRLRLTSIGTGQIRWPFVRAPRPQEQASGGGGDQKKSERACATSFPPFAFEFTWIRL